MFYKSQNHSIEVFTIICFKSKILCSEKGGWFQQFDLIGAASVLGSLELNLQPLHSDLEAIHGLDGGLGTRLVVETDEAEALALVGGPVYEDLAADDVAEGEEHLHQLRVSKLLRQMVNEEVAAIRTTQRTPWAGEWGIRLLKCRLDAQWFRCIFVCIYLL